MQHFYGVPSPIDALSASLCRLMLYSSAPTDLPAVASCEFLQDITSIFLDSDLEEMK